MFHLGSIVAGLLSLLLAMAQAGHMPLVVSEWLAWLDWSTDWRWASWAVVPLALVGLALGYASDRHGGTIINIAALVVGCGLLVMQPIG